MWAVVWWGNNMGNPIDDIFGKDSDQSSSSNPIDAIFSNTQSQDSTPQDITNAKQYLDKPVDQGFCERFASQMTDGKKWGADANSSFQNQVKSGLGVNDPTLSNAPIGSKIYFQPSGKNGGNGHVGILVDNQGNFISADYDKVSMNNISSFGQQPMGYVPVR